MLRFIEKLFSVVSTVIELIVVANISTVLDDENLGNEFDQMLYDPAGGYDPE